MSIFERGLPKELEGLGLTPEQIAQAVKDKVDLEAKFKKLETDHQITVTALSTAENGLTEVKAKLTELEANRPKTQPNNGGQPNGDRPTTFTSFLDDEDKAFAERFRAVGEPLANAALSAAASSAKITARMSLSSKFIRTADGKLSLLALWDKWLPEIDKAAETAPLHARGNPTTWLNCFEYVKGTHMEDLMSKPSDFVEPVESAANVRIGGEPAPEKLNAEEQETFNKMNRYSKAGLTPEKLIEVRKKMKFVVA